MLNKVKTFLAFQYPALFLLTFFNSFQERDWLSPPNSSGRSGGSSRGWVGHDRDIFKELMWHRWVKLIKAICIQESN